MGKVGCADEECASILGCAQDAGTPDAGKKSECILVMGQNGWGFNPDGTMWCEELLARSVPNVARTLTSVLAAGYLVVQLLLPLVVAARPGSAAHDFSWDMFSYHLTCAKVAAAARPRGGDWEPVRLQSDFSNWMQLSRVLVPGRLDAYAARVCQRLRAERRRDVSFTSWRSVSTAGT